MDKNIFQQDGNLIIKNHQRRIFLLWSNSFWFVGLGFLFAVFVIIFYWFKGTQDINYKGVIGLVYLLIWGLIFLKGFFSFFFELILRSKPVTEVFTIAKKDARLIPLQDSLTSPLLFFRSRYKWGFSTSTFKLITNTNQALTVDDKMFLNTEVGQKIEVTYYRGSKFVTQIKIEGVTTINDYSEAQDRVISEYLVSKFGSNVVKGYAFVFLGAFIVWLCQQLP